jgi:hypothetical protein
MLTAPRPERGRAGGCPHLHVRGLAGHARSRSGDGGETDVGCERHGAASIPWSGGMGSRCRAAGGTGAPVRCQNKLAIRAPVPVSHARSPNEHQLLFPIQNSRPSRKEDVICGNRSRRNSSDSIYSNVSEGRRWPPSNYPGSRAPSIQNNHVPFFSTHSPHNARPQHICTPYFFPRARPVNPPKPV